MTEITRAQYDFLTRPIDPNRVQHLRGQSHLEAWDVRRHLIRAFGFDGFDIETKALDLVSERQHTHDNQGQPLPPHKPRWTVVYRAEIRLSIKVGGRVVAVFEDGAAGDSSNQPSLGDAHDMAMKTALSQGLKRCAVNLGDQFGLSLYNGGRADPVVHRSLVAPEGGPTSSADLPVDDAPVMPEPQYGQDPGAELGKDELARAVGHELAAVNSSNPLRRAAAESMLAAADAAGVLDEPELAPAVRMVEQSQHRKMHALWRDLGYDGEANRQNRLDATAKILGLPVESSADLTFEQAEQVIRAQEAKKRHATRANGKVGASA